MIKIVNNTLKNYPQVLATPPISHSWICAQALFGSPAISKSENYTDTDTDADTDTDMPTWQ